MNSEKDAPKKMTLGELKAYRRSNSTRNALTDRKNQLAPSEQTFKKSRSVSSTPIPIEKTAVSKSPTPLDSNNNDCKRFDWFRFPDGWNDLDLADAVVKYMRSAEIRSIPVRPSASLAISGDVRAILVDWIIQVQLMDLFQHHLRMGQSTLYLAVQFADRYVHKTHVPISLYQLVGVTALLLAAKLEDKLIPELDQLVHLTENTCTVLDVLEMEKRMLITLDYQLATPETAFFIRAAVDALVEIPLKLREIIKKRTYYITDLFLCTPAAAFTQPSLIATAAIIANAFIIGRKKFPMEVPTLFGWTWTKGGELHMLVSKMAGILFDANQGKLKGAYEKYCSSSRWGELARGSWASDSAVKTLKHGFFWQ